MALYKIRGADQTEYGPVVAEEICRWIAEQRVTAATLAQSDGSADWQPIGALPEFADALRRAGPPVIAPSTVPPSLETPESALGKVIPFKNPNALAAYYVGMFSFVPLLGIAIHGIGVYVLALGILMGVAAVVLGLLGLRLASQDPRVRGHIHASLGILLGTVFGLANAAAIWLLYSVGFLTHR